jgi:DNA-binding SARP family transcriptional activator
MAGGSYTRRSDWAGASSRLCLLGAFGLIVDGAPVETPSAGQRLLALLAMLGRRAHRSRVACELWPDHDQARALSNLRSAIWRMPKTARSIVGRVGASLTLLDSLSVDLDEAADVARRLHSRYASTRATTVDRELLMDDLLPGFDEAWLIVPREQHRQRRLHALETLALDDLADGRPLDAVDTALAAVAAEPLRESAQLLLVQAHLAAGNRAAARDQFHRFRNLLAIELHVEPSAAMTALIESRTTQTVTRP